MSGGNLVRYERYRKGPRTPRSAHARYYYSRSLVLDYPVRRRSYPTVNKTRCQSAPKVMDSHSRSASPREPMRPQHRPPSPPASPGAFDNRAYQHDDADPNHNDSYSSASPQHNGHSKEPNGDTKLPDAVNLELINLTPKNGTKKKDVEVDMNTNNPYDEYFVPVNEHRKFMRGEKLYVTADKRGEKSGCKRPLCWTLLVLVVAAIVAIIALAATGVLFSSAPTTLEQYNTSISSARALGGIGGHMHDHDGHDHDHHDHDHTLHNHEHDASTSPVPEPAPTEHGPDAQNDAPVHTFGLDENDMSLYVPRTVEGEVKIDNEEFTPALEDPESAEYMMFVDTFTDGLKRALFDRNTLENGSHDIIVEVVKLQKGSVVVTYRIHWKPKPNTESTPDLLSAESLKTELNKYLANNNRMINVYHVAEDNMMTKPVLNICQIDNNHCEHGCEFDQASLEFTCTCPHGQILDMTNPKKCMSILENSYPVAPIPTENTQQEEVKVFQTDTNPITTKPIPEKEKQNTESVEIGGNKNVFDWKEPNYVPSVTTTESDADLNLSHIFGHVNQDQDNKEPVPEPTGEASPEPTAEPKAEPEPTAEPEPEPTTGLKSEDDSSVEPKVEAEPSPELTAEPKAEPEPTAKPEPEPKTGLKSELDTAVEHKVESEPTAEPTAEPEPTPEPKAEPQPTPEPKKIAELNPEPTVEPEPEPGAIVEPKAEPESSVEHIAETKPTYGETATYEPIAEPTAEPTAEPSLEMDPKPEPETVKLIEVPTKTVVSESTPLINNQPKSGTESKSEPQDEIKPTSDSESLSVEKAMSTQFSEEKIVEQSNNPTTSNPLAVVSINTVSRPKHESEQNTEHDSSLKSDDEMDITTTRVSISEPHIINEPSYEPKPEIISILSERKHSETMHNLLIEHNINNSTTEQSDWLQFNSDTDMNKPDPFQNNYMGKNNDSEQRSFKSIDIFAKDITTTEKTKEQEILSGTNSEENKFAVKEISNNGNEEIIAISKERAKSDDRTEPPIINDLNVQTLRSFIDSDLVVKDLDKKLSSSEISSENGAESNDQARSNNSISTAIHEGRSLDSNESTPITIATESTIDDSISEHLSSNTSALEKTLMDALEKNKQTEIETTTNKMVADDGLDITFDTINMLYNKSSHNIVYKNVNVTETTDTNNIETTTVSDWLSEAVSEIAFDEAMNKTVKQETTETSVTNIDEIIKSGITKDDFEPDYLNSMSSNNATMKDELLYGMVHDYDSEDSRVKRVNEEKYVSTNTTNEKATVIESKPVSGLIETTTIINYIYNTANKFMNEFESPVVQNSSDFLESSTSSTEKSEPAPVWEEPEAEKELTVKKLENPVTKEENPTTHLVSIDEIIVPTTPLSTMAISNTAEQITVMTNEAVPSSTTKSIIQEIPNSKSDTESQTQVNNLNVTIYEISSSNGNNSSIAVPNQHSGEFEDHETEMNPFLPEVENNKSLVKKLQEGHDIEPTNFNETQNENAEEHFNNTSETTARVISSNDLTEAAKTNANPTTTTHATTAAFNEFMKSESRESYTEESKEMVTEIPDTFSEVSKETSKSEPKEAVPISTFFLDTDDLDNDKEQTTEHKTTIAENNLENGGITPSLSSSVDLNDESDYLSVVPIEEERLEEKEALKKDYGSELNDISDSPKKSDRRTLGETKFDTVDRNEA